MSIPTAREVLEKKLLWTESTIRLRIDELENRLKDIKASLVGGYSSEWGFDIKDPVLDQRPRIDHNISRELHRESVELVSLSRIMLQYETLVSTVTLLDMDANLKKKSKH